MSDVLKVLKLHSPVHSIKFKKEPVMIAKLVLRVSIAISHVSQDWRLWRKQVFI